MSRIRPHEIEPDLHQSTAGDPRTIGVAVIGLGRIASGYDEQTPAPDVPRSHIGAIRQTDSVRLLAAVEPDAARRESARAHWQDDDAQFVDTIDKVSDASVDAVVICTPSDEREPVFEAALELRPHVVVVEKPLAATLDEAHRMAAAAEQADAALYVNFHRRFDPRHRTLRQRATAQPLARIVATYNNGLHNYASHAVDLLLDWFGPIERVTAIGAVPEGDDPNLSFGCRLSNGPPAVVLGIDGLDYDLFDIQFYGADTRLDLLAGGARLEQREAISDRYYAGYRHLSDGAAIMPDGPVGGLDALYQSLRDHLTTGAPFGACSAAQAIDGLAVLEAAELSAATNGCPIDPRALTGAPQP